MNSGWVRLGLILLVVLVPGGLAGALFWRLWSKRGSDIQSRTNIDPMSDMGSLGRQRGASQIGVPRFVGPPYLYTENLKRLS